MRFSPKNHKECNAYFKDFTGTRKQTLHFSLEESTMISVTTTAVSNNTSTQTTIWK